MKLCIHARAESTNYLLVVCKKVMQEDELHAVRTLHKLFMPQEVGQKVPFGYK